jgi:two-component system, chemotaxis family, sensor kinase CheA
MNEEFERHREAFLSEAKVCLDVAGAALLKLEKIQNNKEYLHEIFRSVHTLKSMAAALNFEEIATLCHVMEDLLDLIKSGNISSAICIDELFSGLDLLNQNLLLIKNNKKEKSTKNHIERLHMIIDNKSTKNIESLLPGGDQDVNQLPLSKIQSIEVKVEKLDALLNLVEELFVCKMKLNVIKDDIDNIDLTATADSINRTISDLQYIVMKIRMISLGFIFEQFPRLVRDLAKKQDKVINLNIQGADIELDRAIIDEINESLVHLIRNAVSHGIETKEIRKKEKKPVEGSISIIASRSKESVTIEIKDDGEGLNLDEIKKVAMLHGLIKSNDPNEKIMDSIFSGISTSKEVTSVSGRGLGLNIVKKKIESVDGTIRVKSEYKKGTTFFISIPLSLAVIKALFVTVGGILYAIPITGIQRLVQLQEEEIKDIGDDQAILLDKNSVPVINLNKLFDTATKSPGKQSIVVVKKDGIMVGLIVDELISTQEIVIKPLNHFVKESKYFSGSTIVGSGEVILVLDINNLISSISSTSSLSYVM